MKEDEFLKLDNQLCFVLYAASRVLTRLYGPFLDRLNITYPQYLVMLVLWEHETLSVGDIGRLLYLDSGTLTPLLKRLEAVGLITRKRLPEDERKVMAALSPRGKAMKQKAASVPLELFCKSGLTVEEFQSIKNDVTKLLEQMNADLHQTDRCRKAK
ncbi:MAG: transcriptional regulator, MarR family [Deltaproteobacteria bacterium]|nr:transcriptional regulator, MarR family [Deltaproteobacteria bacterium]